MCDNYVPQWWVEFNDELSWLFTNRFSATRYMKVKRMGKTEILRRIWLFSANKITSSESLGNEPTQLIIDAHNCHTNFTLVVYSNVPNQYPQLFTVGWKVEDTIWAHFLRRRPKKKLSEIKPRLKNTKQFWKKQYTGLFISFHTLEMSCFWWTGSPQLFFEKIPNEKKYHTHIIWKL